MIGQMPNTLGAKSSHPRTMDEMMKVRNECELVAQMRARQEWFAGRMRPPFDIQHSPSDQASESGSDDQRAGLKRPPSSGGAGSRDTPDAKRYSMMPYVAREPAMAWDTYHRLQCDRCNFKARHFNELIRHCTTVHQETLWSIRQPKQEAKEVLHSCDKCSYQTSDIDAIVRHESEHRTNDWLERVRYPGPNGLVVPLPPAATQRRSSPHRADSASVSPPVKQASPRSRAAEDPTEEGEDPAAGRIRLMKAKGEFPCRICDQVFPNLRAMKGHNRVHMNQSPYACNVCEFYSGDKSTLTRHMKDHNGERPYECRVCKFAFTTKANCERHLKNRHQLKLREELTENMSILTGDGVTSTKLMTSPPPPTKSQPPPAALSSSARNDLTVCSICDASFGEYTPAVQHVRKFHPTKEPALVLAACRPDATSRSSGFGSAPSALELSQRLPLPLPPLLPLSSGLPEGPSSAPSRSSTPRSVARTLSPQSPPADESAPLDLSRRSRPEPPPPPPELPPLTTPPSEETLRSAALLQMPFNLCMPFPMPLFMPSMLNMPMEDMLRPTRSPGLGSGGGIITPAQVQAALQSAFNAGARVHLPPTSAAEDREADEDLALNLAPSTSSGATGSNDETPKKQKQRRYRTQRPFMCVHCKATFTLNTNMDRHVKKTHPDKWEPKSRGARRSATAVSPGATPAEPPSASDPGPSGGAASATVVCVESDDEGGLVIDEPARRDEDLASVDRLLVSAQAQTCQQYFRSDEERSEGSERGATSCPSGDDDPERAEKRRSAYSSAPNKIPCRFCDRVFPWSSSLKRHELTHSGEKPFRCPHCPVHFTTKSNCDRHLVRKHSGAGGSGDGAGAGAAALRVPERPFKCALCPSSTFSTQENLVRHHAQKHAPGASGPATHQFWCHVCDRRFFDLERARDHLEAEHEQSWARLERRNSCWVSQIAEEDQGQDQVFCLVCLSGFSDTSDLRQHMASEHLAEDSSDSAGSGAEDAPCAAQKRASETPHSAASLSPPLRTTGPPRKRRTLEDISARLRADSRMRVANHSPAEEERNDTQEQPNAIAEERNAAERGRNGTPEGNASREERDAIEEEREPSDAVAEGGAP